MRNCFCGMVEQRRAFWFYFQPRSLSEILTIANLWHATSRIWTCTESEFRLCWIKLCISDNQYSRNNGLLYLIKFFTYPKTNTRAITYCIMESLGLQKHIRKVIIRNLYWFPKYRNRYVYWQRRICEAFLLSINLFLHSISRAYKSSHTADMQN